jgi:hypothetical protein
MDSKNVIWLSSFFSLLFITFCVTRHLDDLNPNIVSLPDHNQSTHITMIDDNTLHNIVTAPKVETPKVETPKVETPKVETPKVETPKVETPKVETPKVETPVLAITKKPKASKKPIKTPLAKKIDKPTKKHKPVHKKERTTKKTTKEVIKHKRVALGKLYLQSKYLNKLQNNHEFNELNKLIYMHGIKKDTKIVIVAPNKKTTNIVKNYLLKHSVQTKDIRTIIRAEQQDLIKITLTGRK